MVEPYKPIYTVKEAAGVLRVNPSKVYELISTKKASVFAPGPAEDTRE